ADELSDERACAKVEAAGGDSMVVSTTAIGTCSSGSCGQTVWYEPQAKHSSFEVVASRVSKIRDSGLNFVWIDHDRPNVFLASFGPDGSSVQLADSTDH